MIGNSTTNKKMIGNITIDKSILVLVEGRDDDHFLDALARDLGIRDTLQILRYNGKAELRDFLFAIKAVQGFEIVRSIGVTGDSDEHPERRVQSINNSIIAAGFHVPDSILTTSFTLFPDPDTPGTVETLLLRAIEDHERMKCVEDFLNCSFPNAQSYSDKSKLWSFLSAGKKPGFSLKTAFNSGEISRNHSAFSQIREFLEAL
ncbi:MAG: DUF3226 domain-containing protein [Candidatus Heimdallarchaeota archaeon]